MDKERVQASIARMLERMTPPIEGGCGCGAVTYTISAKPVWSGHCHCKTCQQHSGAPFVSAFNVPVASFAAGGQTTVFRRSSDSGHMVTALHCAKCGAWMCGQSDGNPGLIAVLATTLRDPSTFSAISNVYLSEAAPWITPPPARFNFDRMPVWAE